MASTHSFDSGATRDGNMDKLDYEGFLSPYVLERYAQYMHKNRKLPDGSYRESDNWQLGIPLSSYMKSMWRHFMSVWKAYRGEPQVCFLVESEIDELCALFFNVHGMLHERLRQQRERFVGCSNTGGL